MIGAIIGDIVGSRFEFNNNTTERDFTLSHPLCDFTDDTICTIAIADAILRGILIEIASCIGAVNTPIPKEDTEAALLNGSKRIIRNLTTRGAMVLP